jgi:hypothetical protein
MTLTMRVAGVDRGITGSVLQKLHANKIIAPPTILVLS